MVKNVYFLTSPHLFKKASGLGHYPLLTYLTLFRKIDFYLVLEDKSSPYDIFTIIWNLSPALISKCLKGLRFLLLKCGSLHLI